MSRLQPGRKAGPVIPPELCSAPIVPDLTRLAIDARTIDGLNMEFGVYQGRSLREIRHHLPASTTLYGFDSFEGLLERWREMPRGTFATAYRPTLPNTVLVEGWFDQTLPRFASEHPEPVAFMHIDCDLYASTRDILAAFARQIVTGTVILFDELFGFEGFEAHEWRALKEFGRPFRVIGRWNAFRAAVVMA